MKRRAFFVVGLLFLMTSCGNLLNEIKEQFTSTTAKYFKNVDGGITIKDFEGNVSPKELGLTDDKGKPIETLSFGKPENGIMSCNEVPVDFVKINDVPGVRAVSPSPYVGTWESFVPMEDGFKRLFMDLRNDGSCKIYLEVIADSSVEIKTRVKTVLNGTVKKNAKEYVMTVTKGSGYASSIGRVTATLEIKSSGILTASFEANGKSYSLDVFKLASEKGNKKTYVGNDLFAKDVTLVIDGNNFTLTVPEGIVLPKKFNK